MVSSRNHDVPGFFRGFSSCSDGCHHAGAVIYQSDGLRQVLQTRSRRIRIVGQCLSAEGLLGDMGRSIGRVLINNVG
jgi:hypothetical protein